MALHCFEILLFLYAIVPQHQSLFSGDQPVDLHRIRLRLGESEQLFLPKHTTSIKIVHPFPSHDKFYPFLVSKPLKKLPISKYVKSGYVGKLTLPDSLKLTDTVKNVDKEVEELFRPVSLSTIHSADHFNSLYSPITQIHRDPQFDDVKPVTEIIEGDLKYDFRTKTHSI